MCEKGASRVCVWVDFASGLQCTSPSLPTNIALPQPYLAFALPVVATHRAGDGVEIVWEVSGENVCDPEAHPKPVAAVELYLPLHSFTINTHLLTPWVTGMD